MRIQRVQAKRKALDLSQDGKCCGLMTRKASYAFRQSWMSVYEKCFFDFPDPHDFERISPRVQRKRAKDARRFYRSFGPMENDSKQEFGIADQDLAHVFDIPPDAIGEAYNR